MPAPTLAMIERSELGLNPLKLHSQLFVTGISPAQHAHPIAFLN
jgi:hypothetical protein